MIAKIRNIDEEIIFSEQKVNTLEIHNRQFFREIISALAHSQFEKTTNDIINFGIDGGELNDNIILVNDVFSFDFAARKFLTEIYKIAERSIDNDILKIINRLESDIDQIANFVEDTVDIDLNYKTNIELGDILKMLKIEPAIIADYDIKNRIYAIIDLANKLLKNRIICFVNLKQLLSKNEFDNIAKYCLYKKQLVWFFESSQTFVNNDEDIVVVDDDLFCCKKYSQNNLEP